MTREEVVLITLVTYKVVLVAIGVVTERRTRDGTDFFLGGRRLGPMVAAVSASASSSSAWTLLGVSGAAYADGLSAIWIFPACVGGFLLNWIVLAPALRRYSHATGAVTVTDVLARRGDGSLARNVVRLASFIVLVSLCTYVASQYQAAGKSLSKQFALGFDESVLIGAGVVLVYTLLGGFWAVSVTDTLQGLVMVATSLVLPTAALIAVGGPAGLVEQLGNVAPDGYLALTKPGPITLGVGAVFGLLGIGLGYPGQPHVVNRFMALKQGDAPLRNARRIAIGWAVIVYSGMLLLGVCGRALHPTLADGEVIFIVAMEGLFHPVVVGVMLAAVLSAIMSTADSQLLVAASAITHDLHPDRPGGLSQLARSRIAVAVLGALAVWPALTLEESIFKNVLFAWAAMGTAFGPLLLVRVVLRRAMDPNRTFAVMLFGFTFAILTYVATNPQIAWLEPGLRWFWTCFVAFALTFALAWKLSAREAR
ncbi:MAG: sodium/proline symporter [Planctomycetota bacterium]|nr:sodium/proline symporter [Planctomycetota bacterium]